MERKLRWYDYITVNIYWFALTTRSQVLTPLVLPLLIQQFVGEEFKGTYYGIMRWGTLMFAVLIQALMGLLSDRSTSRWGRRRPFIAAGAVGEVIVFIAIGLTIGMSGMLGYWVLFALTLLSMLTANTAHAATQGLIPDLVPLEKRGRFSGFKALLELPLPLIFVSFVVGKMVSAGNLWGALIALCVVLIVCMLITMLVREEPLKEAPPPLNWEPFLRLLGMTVVFALIILAVAGTTILAVRGLAPFADAPLGRVMAVVVGFAAMALATAVGVWLCIHIGIGREAREQPSFIWWVVNRLAFLIASTNLASFILYFLQERFADLQGERAAGPAAIVVMLVGVFILLTALPGGWLADRLGKKRLVAASGIIAMLGTLIVVAVPSLIGVYIGGSLAGVAIGLFYTASWALGTEIVPAEQAGRYLGISNLAGAGAGAIGAFVGGPIADRMGYVLLFVIYALLFLSSVLALTGVRERR